MRRILVIISLVSLITNACSQREPQGCVVIEPNLENIEQISLEDYKPVLLDSNIFIGRIKRVIFKGDHLLLQSSDMLYGFNKESGTLRTTFSNIGRSEREYLSLLGVWIENEHVAMYDFDAQKVLYHSLEGEYLYTKKLSNGSKSFQQLCPLGRGYIGRRTFSSGAVPELSYYDENISYVDSFGVRSLNSGIIINYPFFMTGEEVLYSPYFRNEIEEISSDSYVVKYLVDFKKYNYVNDADKDEFELLQGLVKGKRVATCISNIYESEGYFCFQFLFNGQGARYCIYDKELKTARVFSFDNEGYTIDSMHTDEDCVNVFVRRDDDSVQYYTIPMSRLYNHS